MPALEWKEIQLQGNGELSDADIQSLHQALGVLHHTFPDRYDKYSIKYLRIHHKKMEPVVPQGGINKEPTRCLRFWRHLTEDIGVFFFLRKRPDPQAYCMSVAVKKIVTAGFDLQSQLMQLCNVMVRENPKRFIEILGEYNGNPNSVQPIPAAGHALLEPIFAGSTRFEGIVDARNPTSPTNANAEAWPNVLTRWWVNTT